MIPRCGSEVIIPNRAKIVVLDRIQENGECLGLEQTDIGVVDEAVTDKE